jgi:phage major head subunit gpT-like protein
MGQLTPSFLMDLEKRMRIISSQDYDRLNNEVVWNQIAKELTSDGKSERLIWLLDTLTIQYQDRLGGTIEYTDILSNTTEFTAKSATSGLKLHRYQLDDHNGGGVQLAAHWARGVGAYAAYWPQKQVMKAIREGGNAGNVTYDSQIFFSSAHPINPFDASVGTFSNDLTGSASGTYPGACPIHATGSGAVALDVAASNLWKAIKYVRSWIMPNGEDPRKLRVRGILAPPALQDRAVALTNAEFIAGATNGLSGGSGSTDFRAIKTAMGLGQPIIVDELGAGITGGSDTTYYLLIENIMSDQLGALVYVNREPFEVVYNTGMTDSELQKANDLIWTTRGRNVVAYGHPYLLVRCQGA